ncbi:unnamed protein product [Sphagnum jensenii]|uniref:Uncharacterized protein n=1 Tax=Sphagnum jensenii TaxID=128206 RepID=A0ABP1B5Q6_9BRYO
MNKVSFLVPTTTFLYFWRCWRFEDFEFPTERASCLLSNWTCNRQATCSPIGLATPPTIPAPIPLHPRQALPHPQIQAPPLAKQCPRQAHQRKHQ